MCHPCHQPMACPAQTHVHPTKQCVKHQFYQQEVNNVYPTHTTNVNHLNTVNKNYFPHTESNVFQQTQQSVNMGPGYPMGMGPGMQGPGNQVAGAMSPGYGNMTGPMGMNKPGCGCYRD